jgi:hypothetical protein
VSADLAISDIGMSEICGSICGTGSRDPALGADTPVGLLLDTLIEEPVTVDDLSGNVRSVLNG